ncbi:MAG: 3',5'-cyclic AMP phosphodiesterase CpdA [Desulforhopalus sp.]|jgi:3',5'-cyclic AMP phosphodiesterase CpdA
MAPPSSDTAMLSSSTKKTTEDTAGKSFVLAHFSDPHFARVDHIGTDELLNKRLLGYLKWKLKRQGVHSDELITILNKDLQRTKPDHIAITGDLTQLGLPIEFEITRDWLQTLGTANKVTVIPGNHDTYVETDWHKTFAHWLDYMEPDVQDQPTDLKSSLDGLFPTLRIRNRIALIGVNTAYPCGLHLATGKIGDDQLRKLEIILKQISGKRLFRIILIHHPPVQSIVSWRRRLTDASSLRIMLKRYGAELVLFGHAHKISQSNLETPSGLIPAMGAPSISSLSAKEERRARYYLYTITSTVEGWKVHLDERIFSLEHYRFVDGRQQHFIFPDKAP